MSVSSPLTPTLKIALKEWQTVIDALATGHQILLLRKGGIYESAGQFELEHRQFAFFPTFIHQNLQSLKPTWQPKMIPMSAEPQSITLSTLGHVTDIVKIKSRSQFDALTDNHIWEKPLIDMRFNYRPENPLYLLLVRTYTLPAPITLQNTPAYAGCKSWVPLDSPISSADAVPVLPDDQFSAQAAQIKSALP